MTTTQGISPKATAAAGSVTGGGLLASLINLVVVGKFDTTSIILALSGSAGGLLAFLSAWLAKPGPIQTEFHELEAVAGQVEHLSPGLLPDLEQLMRAEVEKHFAKPAPMAPIPPAQPAPAGDFVPAPAAAPQPVPVAAIVPPVPGVPGV